MINGNELDVRNFDFELQAWRGDKFLFYIVFELQRIVHISSLWQDVWLRWGLDQNVAFQIGK